MGAIVVQSNATVVRSIAGDAAETAGEVKSEDLKPNHQVTASEAAYSVLFIMTTLSAAWYGLTAITGVMVHERASYGDFAYAYHHAMGNTFIAYLFTRIYAVVHLIDEKAHDDLLISSLPKFNTGVERLCRLAAVLWVIVVFKPYEPLLNGIKGIPYLQSISLWFGDLATRLSFILADNSFGKTLFHNHAIAYTNIDRFHTYNVEHTYVKSTVGFALMLIVFAFIIWDMFVFILNFRKIEVIDGLTPNVTDYHRIWTEEVKPFVPFSVTTQIFAKSDQSIISTSGSTRKINQAVNIIVRLFLYIVSWRTIDRLVLLFIAIIISRSDFQIMPPVSALFPILALVTVTTGVYFHRTFLTEFFDLMLSPATFVTSQQYGRPVGGIVIVGVIAWAFIGPVWALVVTACLLGIFILLVLFGKEPRAAQDVPNPRDPTEGTPNG